MPTDHITVRETEPPFEVRCLRVAGGVARVVINGEVDLMTADALHVHLAPLAQAGEPTVLDLRRVTFMDSSGVRVLLYYAGLARRDGWELTMLGPHGDARTVMELCGIESELPLVQA